MKTSIIKQNTHKISKSLNGSTASKFVTKKSIEINDLSSGQYSVNKNLVFKTPSPRSDLCNYSNAYIAVKGIITAEDNNSNNREDKKVIFKNNSPFR